MCEQGEHYWKYNKGSLSVPCLYCNLCPPMNNRLQCNKCNIESCGICLNKQNKIPEENKEELFKIINPKENKKEKEKQIEKFDESLKRIEQKLDNFINRYEVEKAQQENKMLQLKIELLEKQEKIYLELLNSNKKEIENIPKECTNITKIISNDNITNQSSDEILINPFICNNDKPINEIKIDCRLQIDENEKLYCRALIDSGATHNVIDETIIPKTWLIKTNTPYKAVGITGEIHEYNTIVKPATISFITECYTTSEEYEITGIYPRQSLHQMGVTLILGLQYLIKIHGSILLNRHSILMFPTTVHCPNMHNNIRPYLITQSVQAKRGGASIKTTPTPLENKKEEISKQIKRFLISNAKERVNIAKEACNNDSCCEQCNMKKMTNNEEPNIKEEEFSKISPQEEYTLMKTFSEEMNKTKNKLPLLIENKIKDLERKEIIGNNPLKYWYIDKPLCEIRVKNPDLPIICKNIKQNLDNTKEIKMHLTELLEMGYIRKAYETETQYRSPAFIVQNHAEIIRGKSRMVIDYRRLNDNVFDDSYNIPDRDMLIERIQNSKYFSKLDCKSGFYHIKLTENSIEKTAFTTPFGHYVWLVMPFGYKNAPAIFQRRMDEIFIKHMEYCFVYIDDILIFSQEYSEHINHVLLILEECEKHGIILSKKKMELLCTNINILGFNIGNNSVKLQPHIATKILEFKEDYTNDKKGLQRFLGIVNYARNFLPGIGKYLGPLYSKVSPKSKTEFNEEDIKLIKEIKKAISQIKPMRLPLVHEYRVIQTDASEIGWGGILLVKETKNHPKESEEIVRYASGVFRNKNKSSFDYEMDAVINSLKAFEFFILGRDFTLRTDCEALKYFYKTLNTNKIGRRRWIEFRDYILSRNFKVNIEHIKGSDNFLADTLSRYIQEEVPND